MGIRHLLALGLAAVSSAAVAVAAPARSGLAGPHCTTGSMASAPARHAPRPLVAGHPSSILLCHYGPLPQHLLVGSRLVTSRARLHKIVHGLNALPPMPRQPIACPVDNGAHIVLIVLYGTGPTRVIDAQLSGCEIVRRGSVVRWDAPRQGRFLHWLASLAP